ncbi:MAG: YggS family pyridoxal phosphate-dependent enzyme, partial [Anaerolineae bacterium]|nr:YggS family pyridoxal phosphate-dependent enzyme [Anaerolineae bacterium]
MNNTAQIPARLNDLQTRINQAASEAGRDINEITLVAVSKGHPSALVNAGYEAGLRVFGENYAEEGKTKMEDLSGLD